MEFDEKNAQHEKHRVPKLLLQPNVYNAEGKKLNV